MSHIIVECLICCSKIIYNVYQMASWVCPVIGKYNTATCVGIYFLICLNIYNEYYHYYSVKCPLQSKYYNLAFYRNYNILFLWQ